MMLRKNDIIDLKIESVTNLGFGVGRHMGIVIFVSGAVMGDEVKVKIIKSTPSYAVGRVEKIIKLSDERCDTRCGNKACTSCAYKYISYEKELELKQTDVKGAFQKAGLKDIEILPTVPSPKLKEYRNKGQYPITRDKFGEYTVGFYAPKTHNVKEARDCALLPSEYNEIINTLTVFFKEKNVSVYDEKTGDGILRHIYLRRGEVSGEILLTLVITKDNLPDEEEFTKLLTKKFPKIVGILINTNRENTNVILGDKFKTIFGRDHIFDTVLGVELKITAPAFYQVNHGATELLYQKAKDLAMPTKEDTILDLFCGAGSIGLTMAKDVHELIGIEIVDSAVRCARENANRNGVTNAKFYTGDASVTENLLKQAERELKRKIFPTIIILDPPRAGCDERLLNFVVSLSPKKIVYISCNPQTLARDMAILKPLGYTAKEVATFDLFPMTGHVESVVCLTRRLDN